jgi:hypothetical protein
MCVSGRTIVEEFELIRHDFNDCDEPSFQPKRCPPGIHVIRRTSSPPAPLLPLTSHPPARLILLRRGRVQRGDGARVPARADDGDDDGGGGGRESV